MVGLVFSILVFVLVLCIIKLIYDWGYKYVKDK